MATFYNQATLSFRGNLTGSNVVSGEIINAVEVTKTAVTQSYGEGESIAYTVSIANNGLTEVGPLTVTDDLGAFTQGTLTVTPLTYLSGSIKYYLNGVLQTAPTVEAGPPLVISGITIPTGANALIVYAAEVNTTADLTAGSAITNTATLGGACEEVTSSVTVPVREETDLIITKSVCPEAVSCNQDLNYTFIIQNGGNTGAVATDDVIITDTFVPIFTSISVTYNGEAWTEGVNYTYDTQTGEFATLPGQITVPAATYERDPVTGLVTKTPGNTVIKVTGTL
jgi:hypothetical protein